LRAGHSLRPAECLVEGAAEGKAIVQAVHVGRLQGGILTVVGEGDHLALAYRQAANLGANEHIGGC